MKRHSMPCIKADAELETNPYVIGTPLSANLPQVGTLRMIEGYKPLTMMWIQDDLSWSHMLSALPDAMHDIQDARLLMLFVAAASIGKRMASRNCNQWNDLLDVALPDVEYPQFVYTGKRHGIAFTISVFCKQHMM